MTDKITVPRETWDAMRGALEKTQGDINWMLNSRQFLNGHVFDYVEAALIAANAVSEQQFCYCNPDVSLQMVSGGGAPEGYLGRVTLRIGDQYRDYHSHPQATEPAGYKLVPVELTPEMCDAARWSEYGEETRRQYEVSNEFIQSVWASLLAAAPEAKQ